MRGCLRLLQESLTRRPVIQWLGEGQVSESSCLAEGGIASQRAEVVFRSQLILNLN